MTRGHKTLIAEKRYFFVLKVQDLKNGRRGFNYTVTLNVLALKYSTVSLINKFHLNISFDT